MAKKRRPITAEDLCRIDIAGDPQISPDGSQIVFVRRSIGKNNDLVVNLWIVSTDGRSPPRQFTTGGKDVCPRWSSDGKRIAFISAREGARLKAWTIPADGGEASLLATLPEGRVGGLAWSPDGRWIAVGFREEDPDWTTAAKKERAAKNRSEPPRVIDDLWYRLDGDGYFNAQRYALYLVDAASGEHRKVWTRDRAGAFSCDFSPDSKRLAIASNIDRAAILRPWKAAIWIYDIASGRSRRLPDLPDGPKERVIWSPDGKLLAYAGRAGTDSAYSTENLELFVCDARRGGARSLTAHTDYCLFAVTINDSDDLVFGPVFRWHPDGDRLLAQIGWHGEIHIASIDVARPRLRMLTKEAGVHALGTVSADGRRVATVVSTPTRPPDVCVGRLSRSGLPLKRLTDLNGDLLREIRIARPTSHWVPSTDGTRVQTFVLRPPESSSRRKLPAVVYVHGGPHAQYAVSFFHELQFLAARGYAVFYSNPRGSKGYGQAHCAAIRGDWGNKDWDDIRAVTDFAAARPWIDANRLAIAGGSYGGYMANWAIGHSDAYACAISDRCVSNLVSMVGTTDHPERPDRYWSGNAWDRPESLWSQSPLRFFGDVDTPTLIIHSEGDLRCNVEQAEQAFTALQLRGVPSRFVRYPRSTSHGMSRSGPPDLRIDRLHRIVEWLDRYSKKPRRRSAKRARRS